MVYRGMMDGWNGDEYEIFDLEARNYDSSDEAYEAWRDEEQE